MWDWNSVLFAAHYIIVNGNKGILDGYMRLWTAVPLSVGVNEQWSPILSARALQALKLGLRTKLAWEWAKVTSSCSLKPLHLTQVSYSYLSTHGLHPSSTELWFCGSICVHLKKKSETWILLNHQIWSVNRKGKSWLGWCKKASRITFIERYPRNLLPKKITIHSRVIALQVHCYSLLFTLFSIMNSIFTSCGIFTSRRTSGNYITMNNWEIII